MKYLLLSIAIFCSMLSFGQESDSNLFQTWYLYSVQQHDGAPEYVVSEIEPIIVPSLTIKEDLIFTGNGDCNTFNGKINLLDLSILEVNEFSSTSDDCGGEVEAQNTLETHYFDFMKSANSYIISSEGGDLVLIMYNGIFGRAIFKNKALSSKVIASEQFEIYPNPTNSFFYLKDVNNSILKIELFDSLGKKIKTITSGFEVIDVSEFLLGIYTIKIYTKQGGVVNKKVMKE